MKRDSVNTAKLGDAPLNLWLRRRAADTELTRQVARIVLEAGEDMPTPTSATAAGDPRRLRGIPAIGYGVGGALAGTQPEQALLHKEVNALKQRQRSAEVSAADDGLAAGTSRPSPSRSTP